MLQETPAGFLPLRIIISKHPFLVPQSLRNQQGLHRLVVWNGYFLRMSTVVCARLWQWVVLSLEHMMRTYRFVLNRVVNSLARYDIVTYHRLEIRVYLRLFLSIVDCRTTQAKRYSLECGYVVMRSQNANDNTVHISQ